MDIQASDSQHKNIKVDRKIIHVDMDAFYVSVEIRDNPSLKDQPVAVGGNRLCRGVLSTCNYLAREFGVRSAMPTSVALRKCPNLVIVPSRMHVYKEVSRKLRDIFERYTHIIEPLSLDEAYLDVSQCRLFKGSATLIAEDIRQTIHQELGLTASAGVAPLKFLAKVASDFNKPNGQFVIIPSDVHSFIADLPLQKISGVGKVTFDKLSSFNLKYGRDIQKIESSVLSDNFGKFGRVLYQRCQGIDNRSIETTRIRKSVGVERTFSEDTSDIVLLHKILLEQLVPELKKRAEQYIQQRGIHKVGIKVKFSDFQQTTKDYVFAEFDNEIFCRLLNEAVSRGQGKKVRLIGVHIGLKKHEKINNEEDHQLQLDF